MADAQDLDGRLALVTGASRGIGHEVARGLARAGATVVLVGRDAGKLAMLRTDLVAANGEDRFTTVVADMSSLDQVRSAAEAVRAAEVRLDVLVDNAGSIYPQRTVSRDGIEASMALMAVGPFALVAQDGSRIDPGRATVALCRCGRSATKPFCDGSHKVIGFRAPGGADRPPG